MLFVIIISIVVIFIVIALLISKKASNKKTNINNIEINFEDIDSLNVSKIVKDENDIDFLRNELWFNYKQKSKINQASFYKLKQIFEQENNIKINELEMNETAIDPKSDLMPFINNITSDEVHVLEIAKSFYIVENYIKFN